LKRRGKGENSKQRGDLNQYLGQEESESSRYGARLGKELVRGRHPPSPKKGGVKGRSGKAGKRGLH